MFDSLQKCSPSLFSWALLTGAIVSAAALVAPEDNALDASPLLAVDCYCELSWEDQGSWGNPNSQSKPGDFDDTTFNDWKVQNVECRTTNDNGGCEDNPDQSPPACNVPKNKCKQLVVGEIVSNFAAATKCDHIGINDANGSGDETIPAGQQTTDFQYTPGEDCDDSNSELMGFHMKSIPAGTPWGDWVWELICDECGSANGPSSGL